MAVVVGQGLAHGGRLVQQVGDTAPALPVERDGPLLIGENRSVHVERERVGRVHHKHMPVVHVRQCSDPTGGGIGRDEGGELSSGR